MAIESRKPILYLCGAMDNVSEDERHGWREEVKQKWKADWCLDPTRRDYGERDLDEVCRELVDLDKRDIMASDITLVNYTRPSVGTSMEILFSWERHMPVVIIDKAENGFISPWLYYHSTVIVDSIDEALDWIKENV